MDPSVPVEEQAEPATKSAGIQTMYRESEAQTMPYTPAHIVPDGTTPEVLLLKNLNYENGGLSVGKKELEMIEYARLKRDVEANLPPSATPQQQPAPMREPPRTTGMSASTFTFVG